MKNEDDGPCWKGYKQVGMKMQNGKEVPNCVPEETQKDQVSEGYYDYPDYGPVGASEMAQTQLHFIKYAADDITRCLKMGCPMPEWYQNKLAKIEGDMEGLYSYMKGKTRKMKAHHADRYSMGMRMYGEETLTEEKKGDDDGYDEFFQAALKKFGVKGIGELDKEKKKEFFNYIDKNWKGDEEEKMSEGKYSKSRAQQAAIAISKKEKKESTISEVLKPSDDVSKWIEDFYKSDAPKFKGKDKEERREMAVAAWLEARREAGYDVEPNPVKEDRDEIDRLVVVSSRDERKANKIAKDMFRGDYTNDGSDAFMFDDEDVADDFRDELKKQKIKILEN
jgi:hypothetical protein